MEFESEPQRLCYEKVAVWMRELFGESAMFSDSFPGVAVSSGSAFADVVVQPWGEDESLLRARAVVVRDPEVNEELLRYLLTENNKLLFGGFLLSDTGDVIYTHSLLGSAATKEAVKHLILGAVSIADRYDDEIVGRWGGQRAGDGG